jgi:hypothetical protein
LPPAEAQAFLGQTPLVVFSDPPCGPAEQLREPGAHGPRWAQLQPAAVPPEPSRVKLRLGAMKVTGAASTTAAVRATLDHALVESRECYAAALVRNPNLVGQVRLDLDVVPRGLASVAAAWDVPDPWMAECVKRAFVVAPLPLAAESYRVHIPIFFGLP